MSAYYAMLEGSEILLVDLTTTADVPRYRMGGEVVGLLLEPAHQIDRLLFPAYWRGEDITRWGY
jgi:hypothetical protein